MSFQIPNERYSYADTIDVRKPSTISGWREFETINELNSVKKDIMQCKKVVRKSKMRQNENTSRTPSGTKITRF